MPSGQVRVQDPSQKPYSHPLPRNEKHHLDHGEEKCGGQQVQDVQLGVGQAAAGEAEKHFVHVQRLAGRQDLHAEAHLPLQVAAAKGHFRKDLQPRRVRAGVFVQRELQAHLVHERQVFRLLLQPRRLRRDQGDRRDPGKPLLAADTNQIHFEHQHAVELAEERGKQRGAEDEDEEDKRTHAAAAGGHVRAEQAEVDDVQEEVDAQVVRRQAGFQSGACRIAR